MTNEEAAAMLERMKNYFLPTSPMLEERREITALDLAISALSKRSASSEQVDHIADDDKMVDQFRDDTKKTDFKPGDKFVLELGQERRMFGEFEIKGTDLYVRTDLLEKLTRYEPEEKLEVKSEIICDPNCEGFICHKNGIYGWCAKAERWGCEYFYERQKNG